MCVCVCVCVCVRDFSSEPLQYGSEVIFVSVCLFVCLFVSLFVSCTTRQSRQDDHRISY